MEWIILGFGVWRVSHLFTHEVGPFQVFLKIREKFGIAHDLEGEPIMTPDGYLPELFSCVWCFSVSFSIGYYALYALYPVWAMILITPFSLSAVAILVDKYASTY